MAVVDLRMPGRSGLELIRDLKTLDAETKIVVLTGYGSIATTIDAMKLGAVYYLPKPADADDVLAAFARGEEPPLEGSPSDFAVPSLERVKWEHINLVLADCGGNVSGPPVGSTCTVGPCSGYCRSTRRAARRGGHSVSSCWQNA
jgi:two-component system response regulator RegA